MPILPAKSEPKKTNPWKWVFIAAVVAAGFIFGCRYGVNSVNESVGTVVTKYRDSIVYRPGKPYKVIDLDTVWRDRNHWYHILPEDSIQYVQIIVERQLTREDTLRILRAALQVRIYDTTIKLKRGTARIIDTLAFNELIGHGIQIEGADTTITKILEQPSKFVGYFTLSATGNMQRNLFGIGTGFGAKMPNDKYFEGSIQFFRGQRPMFQIKTGIPIRLSNRKPR